MEAKEIEKRNRIIFDIKKKKFTKYNMTFNFIFPDPSFKI